METLTFECGHCGKLMAVGTEYLGQQVRCPHCQQVVIAPARPAPTSALPEAAKEEDPLAANPSAPSPFAVAQDAPWWADPATTATDPPPVPVPAPLPTENPLTHLNEPQMELRPSTPPSTAPANDPPAPPPFSAFEAAVDDLTPVSPATAAVMDVPTLKTEPRPSPHFEAPAASVAPPTPDVAAPWGEGAAPPSELGQTGPAGVGRPRRSQMGTVLFVSLVFLPLVLYAVLVTILAVMFYQQRGEGGGGGQPDPRQFLPDVEGDHPGFKRTSKQSFGIPDRYYTDPLPPRLVVGLGQTVTIGDLEVRPERVEWAKVHMRLGEKGPFEVDNPSLVLHLKLRNTSSEVMFYPLDPYFNREWEKGTGQKPLTLVEAGTARYYGGPARWNGKESETVEGANDDKPLGPGESGDYLVSTNCYEDETKKLGKYAGPFLWRVQVRRGLVRYRDKDLSATAVVGVAFSDKDVVRTDAKP